MSVAVALGELDILLGRKLELDTVAGSQDSSVKGGRPANVFHGDQSQAADFSSDEIKLRLKQLQRWLQVVVSPQQAEQLWSKLQAHEKIFENSNKIAAKGRHTKDKQETVDDVGDDQSPTYFLLETFYKVCGALLQEDGFYLEEDLFNPDPKPVSKEAKAVDTSVLQSVPESLISFCFSRLHLSFSGAIRRVAGMCLGFLSKHFLQMIASMFLNSLAAIKKDADAREYVTYQKALSLLDFGFRAGDQVNATVAYFSGLAAQMKKIDRGVLRMEVCESLRQIFVKILPSKANTRQTTQWDLFQASESKECVEFQDSVDKIYQIVKQWSKKDKHSPFCYDVMCVMVCAVRSPKFYTKYSGELFGLLCGGLKKEKLHAKCLECCAFYVRESPEAFVSTDNGFLGRIKALLGLLLPKGKNPEEPDIPAITQIVHEIGERFSTFVFGEYAVEVLTIKKGNYRTTTKAVVMTALGQIARSAHASRLDKYGPALAPLIMHFITEQPKKTDEKKKKDEVLDKRAMLRTAALSCFPYFRESEEPGSPKLLSAIPVIGALTLDPDRGVTSAAVSALTDLMKLDPKTMIVPIVYGFVLLLNNIALTNVQTFLKASNNLSLVLSTVIQVLETLNPAPVVDTRDWVNLRLHLEAACVRWLCHSEIWLRGEVFRVMRQFADPVLRNLEGNAAGAHMIDDLMPRDSPPETPSSSGFSDPLRKLLSNNYDAFKAPLNFAFSLVYDVLPTVLSMDDHTLAVYVHPDNEWWAIFKNILVFCGLAFHPHSALSDEQISTWSAKAKDKKDDAKVDDATAGLLSVRAARAAGIVSVARSLLVPALQNFQVSETDCLEYLDFVFKALHITHSRLLVVGHLTRKSLYHANPAAHSAIVSCLRREYDTQTAKKKLPYADFLYHEHTLELFAQLLLRTNAEEFFKGPVRVTETLDLLVTTMLAECNSVELGARTKVQLVTLLGQSVVYQLKPSNPGESYEAKGSVAINRPSYFQFLTSKNVFPQGVRVRETPVSGDEQEDRALPALEQAVVRCIQALISLGPFDNPFLENQVLRFLHRVPLNRDEHVQAEAQRAMTVFLQLNPKRLDEFICNSSTFTQEDSLQEYGYPAPTFTGDNVDAEQREVTQNNAVEFGIPSLEAIQEMRALVIASRSRARQISLVLGPEETIVHRAELTSPLALRIAVFYVTAVCESWISRLGTKYDWIGTQGVTAATMLAFCLLHRNSPDIKARNQALRLAKALAEKLTPALDPGFKIDELSHSSPFMFVENTLHYSRSLAQPSNGLILPDLLKECERLNQILADSDRQHMFKMLTPWVEQIGTIATNLPNPEAKQPFELPAIFKSIVRLTTQSHRSSATAHVVNELWAAVTRACAVRSFISQIVHFFVDFYSDTEAQQELISCTEDMEPEELRALLKSAFVAMCRGRPFAVVLECMFDRLKHYDEPQSLRSADFLSWTEAHPSASDVVTPQEHSCFDLLSSAVYEHDDLLHDAFPRLLMNACVLFSGTPCALSLLRFVATFLNMAPLTTNTSIATPEFLAAVVSNNGKLRAQWAKEALVWGCMSADPRVASASLEIFQTLTGQEPDFVPLQVVRLSLAIYAAVKHSQKKLVALSEALLAISLSDRANWVSVVAVGWSLLQITRIDAYRSGLLVVQKALQQPRALEWLGNNAGSDSLFVADGSTDKAVASTLVAGLMSADTQQYAVNILSVLAVHFTKASASLQDSHVVCLAVLSTFLFRLMDLLSLMHTRYTVPDLKQPSAEDTDQLLGDVETCLRLTRLLQECKHDGLSRVFYQLSSLLLKDLSTELSAEETARADAVRSALQALQRNSEEFEVPVVPQPSHQRVSFEMFTTGRNQINPIVRFFVGSFLSIFNGREMFDSTLQWFCSLLRHWSGASEQRMVFLLALGHIVQISKHKPSAAQTQQLTEELEKDYVHQKESFRHLVENVAKVLNKESSTPPSFSFLRVRVAPEKGPKTVLMPFEPAQSLQCLAFLESKAFTSIDRLVPATEVKQSSNGLVKENETQQAREREAREREAREREAREREARERETREREAREREAREREAREKEARDKEARDKEARDKEAREREARDKEAKDKEAKEKEAKEKEAKEKEARDKEAKEKEARDKEAKEKEARDKEAKEKEAREKEAKEKEARENEAKEKEAKEKEAKEKEAKEKEEREAKEKEEKEKEAREKEAKEKEEKETKEREAKEAEQAANKKSEPAFANNLNALLKGGPPQPKQPPPPPVTASETSEAPDLVTTRRVAPSIARKAPTLKPFVASATLGSETVPSSGASPAVNNPAPSSASTSPRNASTLPSSASTSAGSAAGTASASATASAQPKASEPKPKPESESAGSKNVWQARIEKERQEKAEAAKSQTKPHTPLPPVPSTKVPALPPTAKTAAAAPATASTKTPTTTATASAKTPAPAPAATTTTTAAAKTTPAAQPAVKAATEAPKPAAPPVVEDDLERASRVAAEKLEQARTKLATLRAKAEKERAEKAAKAAAEELAG